MRKFSIALFTVMAFLFTAVYVEAGSLVNPKRPPPTGRSIYKKKGAAATTTARPVTPTAPTPAAATTATPSTATKRY